jgi:hypothetical protein
VSDLAVEATDQFVGLLDDRRLILADGNHGCLEGRYVSGLCCRVAKEAGGNVAAEAPSLATRIVGDLVMVDDRERSRLPREPSFGNGEVWVKADLPPLGPIR